MAQETVFLDFDIISLTFLNKDLRTTTTIGVVSDPLNIIAGLIAPPDIVPEDSDWWQKIIALLLLIILLIIFWPILSPILSVLFQLIFAGFKLIWKGILWVLGLPFRLFRRGRTRRKERRRNERTGRQIAEEVNKHVKRD